MDARRMPARVRRIKEIDISRDTRVRILGKVAERGADYFFVDGGDDGRIQVLSAPENVSRLYDGQLVRVWAQVLPSDDGIRLRAEIVQDATGMDVKLYKTAEERWIGAESSKSTG